MAFKKPVPQETVPNSPEEIFLQLPRRKIPGVLLHQGQIMQRYVAEAQQAPDVALQLPTGSGKTLVGLLVGEWLRRKNNERVVFLCPTRQLVNQVVAQAANQYGLDVHGFTGPKTLYTPSAMADYQAANRIAVTTYNSLFNTNPFFSNPSIIIVDDAHAAENYIASMWCLRIDRYNNEHRTLYQALCNGVLRPHLDAIDFGRLTGVLDNAISDFAWVDKLPTPILAEIKDELVAIIDQHVGDIGGLKFVWQLLRSHLHACHLYLTSHEIYLRPLIPPTWMHTPFAGARQRIFMSATLGEGGDLERLTGRSPITRLPVPEGWDRQGIGRRFFIFPELSLEEDEATRLRHELMKKVPRSVALVPTDKALDEAAVAASREGLSVFEATAIEESKEEFIAATNSVAIFANRYDGIDFPGDQCRLLFVDGFPKTTNPQERFLYSKAGAGTLLRGRIQTRVVQAVGRCTRSLQDYSAVVISGSEMTDYLNDPARRVFFHPELQAELAFGTEQSTGSDTQNLLENFSIFLSNGKEWEEVNRDILAKRAVAKQSPHPGVSDLSAVVSAEIEYQRRLWQGHYEEASEQAGKVLAGLKDAELRGYRALWHYLAGAAAWHASRTMPTLESQARKSFAAAREAAPSIRWLTSLTRYSSNVSDAPTAKRALEIQVEQMEAVLLRLGRLHEAKYAKLEKSITTGINANEASAFENAQRDLGELLGFRAGKEESDASPDPWWIVGDLCLVFEDHSEAQATSSLGADKARQVAGHPNWMTDNKAITQLPEKVDTLPVLVTPVTRAETGAMPHLKSVAIWALEDFREWAKHALGVVRELRRTLGEECDLAWRAQAQSILEQNALDAPTIFEKLRKASAADYFSGKAGER